MAPAASLLFGFAVLLSGVVPNPTARPADSTPTPSATITGAAFTSAEAVKAMQAEDKCAAPPPNNVALLDRIKHVTRTLPGVPTIDLSNPSANPPNVQRVMRLLPETSFEFLFPRRNKVYTYLGFLQAVAKWPAFCDDAPDGTEKDLACRKELASTFSHFVQETGENNPSLETSHNIPRWRQALYYVREMGENAPYRTNCDDTAYWARYYPCAPEALYYGRGAKQLTYVYNYGPFSEAVFGDRNVLLKDPDMVARDGFLAFASAIWFGLTPQSPKPSMHDVSCGWYQPGPKEAEAHIIAGFGATIHVLNGGIECGAGGASESAQVQNRIAAYRQMAAHFNVPIVEEELGCRNMKPFPADGVAALPLYWDQDWGVEACKCKQVNYQTPFQVLSSSLNYDTCTCHFFKKNCPK